MRFFALADVAACLGAFRICKVFAALPQQHLVQKAVRLAGGVRYGGGSRSPRLAPRNDSVFHLHDDGTVDILTSPVENGMTNVVLDSFSIVKLADGVGAVYNVKSFYQLNVDNLLISTGCSELSL